MLQLAWNFSAQVAGGPAIAASGKPEIGALDKVVVKIKNDGVAVSADLQPSNEDKIVMLVVQSSVPSADITVEITDDKGTPKTTGPLALDQPLLLAGAALKLLTGAPLKAILKFAKGGATTDIFATVELVVARRL